LTLKGEKRKKNNVSVVILPSFQRQRTFD